MSILPYIDDKEDDYDEEAELRKTYPFLYEDYDEYGDDPEIPENKGDMPTEGPVSPPDGPASVPENAPAGEPEGPPNYHYIHELTDDLLPGLDFYRYDNFFAARPAHGFFIDRERPLPCPPRLFDEYWLEGEIAILFADTGAGKSILAMQIAQSIASGFPIGPFAIDTAPQRVAYFDLELSQDQFDRRYSHDDPSRPANFPFHRNLIRNPPHPDVELPDDVKDETAFITGSLVEFILFSKARVVIIDNITWLNNSSQIGNSAQRIMKAMTRMKRGLGLSILVLAHTPKRSVRSPLSVNDMQGSKMIANFADSIFALGSSRLGPDVRYLKTIKRRSTAPTDQDRVATLHIEKDACLLGMKYEGHTDERDHIGWMRSYIEPEKLKIMEKIREMNLKMMTQRTMAKELGISPATVNRYLKAIRD